MARVRAVVAVLMCAAVVGGVATSASAAASDDLYEEIPPIPETELLDEAAQVWSAPEAMALAQSTGRPVEALERRTETSASFALPEGLWLEQTFTAPRWVLDDSAGSSTWVDVDPVLERAPGGLLVPRGHAGVLEIVAAPKSNGVVARVGIHDSDVVVTVVVPGVRGAARVDGSRAIYEGIAPGVDLVLQATPGGLEQFFVVHTAVAAQGDFDVQFEVDGGDIRWTDDGGGVIVDSAGREVGAVPTAVAWDAVSDARLGSPVLEPWQRESKIPSGIELSTTIVPHKVATKVLETSIGVLQPTVDTVELDVSVDGDVIAFGLDVAELVTPDTVFPLVVDPSLVASFDTYVRKAYPNNTYHSSSELLIGNPSTGSTTNIYASFLTFNVSSLDDERRIMSADLKLWNHYSWTCSDRSWRVDLTEPATSSTTWNNVPGFYTNSVTSSDTRGSECSDGAGWVSANVTGIVRIWQQRDESSWGLAVQAGNPSDNMFWKRFYSANHSTSSKRPRVEVTYNVAPDTPTHFWVNNMQVTPGDDVLHEIMSAQPTLKARVSDPDHAQVRALFTIKRDGQVIVDDLRGSLVDSGEISQVTLPFALTFGRAYTFEVKGFDGWAESDDPFVLVKPFMPVEVPRAEVPTDCDEFVGPPTNLPSQCGGQ